MAGKKATGPAGRFANRRKGKQSDFNLLAIVRRICGEPQPFQMEKNELGELEIIVYAFFLYIFVGNLFYMHFQSESLLLDTHKSALARDINGSKIHDKSVKDHSSARRGFEGAMFTGSAVDSIYHAVVTMTTVGYGDVVQKPSVSSRIFSIFHVILGVTICLSGLVQIAGMIIDARDELMKKARKASLLNNQTKLPQNLKLKKKKKSLSTIPKSKSGSFSNEKKSKIIVEEDDEEEEAKRLERESLENFLSKQLTRSSQGSQGCVSDFCSRNKILVIIWKLAIFACLWGGLYVFIEDDWSWIDGAYYTIITGTTIGYGDITPATWTGRLLSIFFVPCAVVFIGNQLGEIGPLILNGDASSRKLQKLMNVDLSLEAILDMDDDGDGSVTEYEFMKFMLVRTEIVEEESLVELHKRFQALDKDGSGALDKNDLITEPLGVDAKVSKKNVEILKKSSLNLSTKLKPKTRDLLKASCQELKESLPPKSNSPRKNKKPEHSVGGPGASRATMTEISKNSRRPSKTPKVTSVTSEDEPIVNGFGEGSTPKNIQKQKSSSSRLDRKSSSSKVRNPVNKTEGSPESTPSNSRSRPTKSPRSSQRYEQSPEVSL